MSRSPGPLCMHCGCYRDEHRSEVSPDWRLIHTDCLTCGQCDQYEPSEAEDTWTEVTTE